jgi:hypothetical protein
MYCSQVHSHVDLTNWFVCFLIATYKILFVCLWNAVAQRVAERKQFFMEGVQLTIEPMKPGRPPPLFIAKDGLGASEDSLLYFDLPMGYTEVESLRTFVANAAKTPVNKITFSQRPGVALVRYDGSPGEFSPVLDRLDDVLT